MTARDYGRADTDHFPEKDWHAALALFDFAGSLNLSKNKYMTTGDTTGMNNADKREIASGFFVQQFNIIKLREAFLNAGITLDTIISFYADIIVGKSEASPVQMQAMKMIMQYIVIGACAHPGAKAFVRRHHEIKEVPGEEDDVDDPVADALRLQG